MTWAQMLPQKTTDAGQRPDLAVRHQEGVTLALDLYELGLLAGLVQRLFHGAGLLYRNDDVVSAMNEQHRNLDLAHQLQRRDFLEFLLVLVGIADGLEPIGVALGVRTPIAF